VFQCFSVSAFQCFSVSAFQCFSVSVFQRFSVSVFQCFSVSVFQCFSVSVFQCFSVSVFQSCGRFDVHLLKPALMYVLHLQDNRRMLSASTNSVIVELAMVSSTVVY
jgi:hypothetical protein